MRTVFLFILLFSTKAVAEKIHTEFIPIPIYKTHPNEGSTFGLMPVFLNVRDETGEVESIHAPSVSFNEVIRVTGTYRWFHYPTPVRSLVATASVSTKINWNAYLRWLDLPLTKGVWTDDLLARVERSVFFRFYGFGPDTTEADETSYTRLRQTAIYRRGLNIIGYFNAGLGLYFSNDTVEDIGVPDIPLSRQVFPNTPGMDGATAIGEFVDIQYDTRANYEYSLNGVFANLRTGVSQGVRQSPGFRETQFDARALFEETSWVSGAARLYWRRVSKGDIPFYYQSTLGGADLLRGFTEGRFTDQGAWTVELEQRFRFLRTHIFDVTADWRVDPYVAVGQVYSKTSNMFNHVQVAQGIGFRAWVRPNILGRVDIGFAGEGMKVYIDLGYPF